MKTAIIKALSDRALNGETHYYQSIPADYIEKFAELIVQECINCCGSDFGTELIKEHWDIKD